MTGSGKTAHFAQYFKIELLVFKDGVALKAIISGIFFVVEVLAVSGQSFLSYRFKPKFEKTLIEVFRYFFSSPLF